jgi:hypothetical protein
MAHADDEQVTYGYESSRNISFSGKGEYLGVTWREWRAMSEEERTSLLTDTLWELAQVYVENE